MSKKLKMKHLFLGSSGLVLAIYLIVLLTTPLTIFWSADEGAKFLQLQTMSRWQGGNRYHLAYHGERLDPTYRFYPDHPVYPQPLPDGQVRFHWAIWFPLLSIIPFKLFGVAGLYLIPLISGLLTASLSGWIAYRFKPQAAPLTVLAVGLASPIFFYSLLFWEHTLVALLALLALWQAMRLPDLKGRARWLTMALIFMLLLATVALRVEMIFYAIALGLAMLYTIRGNDFSRYSNEKMLLAGITIILLLILGAGLFNFLVERGLLSPRYSQLIGAGFFFIQDPNFWLNLPRHWLELWVNSAASSGPEIPTWLSWLGLTGLILSFLPKIDLTGFKNLLGLVYIGTLLIGLVSLYTLGLDERYRTIHSFFLPAPYLGLTCLFWQYARQARRFDATLLAVTTMLYLLFGTAAVMVRQAEVIANLEWGARYLLPLYPMMIICAVVGLAEALPTYQTRLTRYLLMGFVGALLVIGLAYEWRGIREIQLTKADMLPYAQTINALDSSRPIVTDLLWLPAMLSVYCVDREVYVLLPREKLYPWLEAADGQVDSFVMVTFFLLDPKFINLAPRPITVTEQYQVKDVTFMEFRLK